MLLLRPTPHAAHIPAVCNVALCVCLHVCACVCVPVVLLNLLCGYTSVTCTIYPSRGGWDQLLVVDLECGLADNVPTIIEVLLHDLVVRFEVHHSRTTLKNGTSSGLTVLPAALLP